MNDIEDELDSNMLEIDCSKERLKETCKYYDATTLPWIQVYKNDQLMLEEIVDENTEEKIENI